MADETAPFDRLSDEELAALAKHSGDAYGALIGRYLPSLKKLSRLYTRISADRDDLVSEGILGLMSAVHGYDPGRGAGFSTFAGICVNRRMLSALKKSSRIKSREEPLDAEIVQEDASPEKTVLDREALSEVFKEISTGLTPLEKSVFSEYLSGKSYDAVAEKLGINRKAVDNALARVRRKLREKIR